jgi:hypothetical protein
VHERYLAKTHLFPDLLVIGKMLTRWPRSEHASYVYFLGQTRCVEKASAPRQPDP